ncbi:ankyrin repeat-containing protein, partial [Fusarium beomiforme]
MRLLHTTKLELVEHNGRNIPLYAILSHTWGSNEVTYQDFQNGRAAEKKNSYSKIKTSSGVAALANIKYLWIDTCCIDKANNVELTRAINTMYYWYRGAHVCFAYLVDVPSNDDPYAPESYFSKSRWFTRGWTLQELIAPSDVIFFADNWTRIGSRRELSSVISGVTGIPVRFLLGASPLRDASIAQRMSWASQRETTEVEDIAYCLLGIFDIHMPLIYGERENAFRRLQEEILKVTDDQSIFAWRLDADVQVIKDDGPLASSPASFKRSGNIIKTTLAPAGGHSMGTRTPSFLSNRGLHLALPLVPKGQSYLAVLGCSDETMLNSRRTAIWLRDISTDGSVYQRIKFDKLETVKLDSIRKSQYKRICVQFMAPHQKSQPHPARNSQPHPVSTWDLRLHPENVIREYLLGWTLVMVIVYILPISSSGQMFASVICI